MVTCMDTIQTCLVFSLPDCIRRGFSPPLGGDTPPHCPPAPAGMGAPSLKPPPLRRRLPSCRINPNTLSPSVCVFSSPSHLLLSSPPLLSRTSLCAVWSLSPACSQQRCLVLFPSGHPQPQPSPRIFLAKLMKLDVFSDVPSSCDDGWIAAVFFCLQKQSFQTQGLHLKYLVPWEFLS